MRPGNAPLANSGALAKVKPPLCATNGCGSGPFPHSARRFHIALSLAPLQRSFLELAAPDGDRTATSRYFDSNVNRADRLASFISVNSS